MRQLRACDFCGDDALGAFAVVPPELSPTEADQRRVVLCTDCRATLEELLEPLLQRAGVEPDDDTSDGGSNAEEKDAEPVTAPADRLDTAEPTKSGVSIGSEATDDADGPTTNGGTDAAGVVVTPPPADEESTLENETTVNEDSADDEASTSEDESTTGGESPDDESSASPAMPATYGKVLRLLRNRDLPMRRSDVEALASGAYDLDGHEVEALVDAAVERGDLVDDGGRIRLP